MYDSVNPLSIPAGAAMVAGYLDGLYKWSPADFARFPSAIRVAIVTSATTNDGHMLDIERGDAEPGQAPGWVSMRRAAGCEPTVYCNLSTWPQVQEVFASSGVPAPHYCIADWTGTPHIPGGAVACQWTSGPAFDTSAVLDYWPGVDNGQTWPAAPAAPPAVVTGPKLAQDLQLLDQIDALYKQVTGPKLAQALQLLDQIDALYKQVRAFLTD